ncbi:tetratricopeptide repeat protein [Flavobacteriaceae bacterium XHP0103]|uniref:tetratricopeptide repeat protein n=1 Tax=Marixanthotalea marina TaxID=2844359 RepID=UPI002989A752|nr:tetratricopeptide repeat protein [Marixanthotalea marina]MBU3820484.1 tetratricopeptide repeat protein [Marixanthotalea marina]
MKYVIYILAIFFSISGIAQNNVLFEKGNKLYNQGKYLEAIEVYKQILDSDNHSAELYFNLGNAYYKLNGVAPSIYYYEKALQLDPNDKDILNNLAFAKNMTIDAIDTVPEAWTTKLINNIANYMTFDGWAKTAIVFVICFVLLFIFYDFAYTSVKKRVAFIGSMASLVFIIGSLVLAFHKFNLEKSDRPAIVFAQESKVKAEPNLRSEEAFMLHEGTKVQVLDTINNWKKIKLSDGKTGWIPSADIKTL